MQSLGSILSAHDISKKFKAIGIAGQEFAKQNPRPKHALCKHNNPIEAFSVKFNGKIYYWQSNPVECNLCELENTKQSRLENANSDLQIPKRYQHVEPSTEYLDLFFQKEGLVLSGTPGVGKTHSSIALSKAIYIEKGLKAVFISSLELVFNLKKAIADKNLNSLLNYYSNTELLFIDDLGVENETDFVQENLSRILEHRYNELLPILFTTNLSSKDFFQKYGQRIVSRLSEMANFVEMKGIDRRINKPLNKNRLS